jgi:hypothetical protein
MTLAPLPCLPLERLGKSVLCRHSCNIFPLCEKWGAGRKVLDVCGELVAFGVGWLDTLGSHCLRCMLVSILHTSM